MLSKSQTPSRSSTPPRWSETVTRPSWPEIVLEVVEAVCEPSETLLVGALIDSAPAVSVKVVGVSAPAGRAIMAASAATTIPAPRRVVFPKCLNMRDLLRTCTEKKFAELLTPVRSVVGNREQSSPRNGLPDLRVAGWP